MTKFPIVPIAILVASSLVYAAQPTTSQQPPSTSTIVRLHTPFLQITIEGGNPSDVYCEAESIVANYDQPIQLDLPAGHYSCASIKNGNDIPAYPGHFILPK